MYQLTIASTTGNGFRMVGYTFQGQQLQGNTTATTGVNIPSTNSFDTYQHQTVTASADGNLTLQNITFPSTTMKAVFPQRSSGYNSPGWYGLDMQGRLWVWGHPTTAHPYQATTSATSWLLRITSSPWAHTKSSGTGWIGNTSVEIEDLISIGYYYGGYYGHYIRT